MDSIRRYIIYKELEKIIAYIGILQRIGIKLLQIPLSITDGTVGKKKNWRAFFIYKTFRVFFYQQTKNYRKVVFQLTFFIYELVGKIRSNKIIK
jgi:hypothetical protein